MDNKYNLNNNLFLRIIFLLLIILSLVVVILFFYFSKIKIVSLILILACLVLSYKKLVYGAYFVIFSLPFIFIQRLAENNFYFTEIFIFILLFVFCLRNFRKKQIVFKKSKFDVLLILLFVLNLIFLFKFLLELNFSFLVFSNINYVLAF